MIFACIVDRRGRSILSIRDQNTAPSIRRRRLMTLVQLFLIHRYRASSLLYLTPTQDNQSQTERMQDLHRRAPSSARRRGRFGSSRRLRVRASPSPLIGWFGRSSSVRRRDPGPSSSWISRLEHSSNRALLPSDAGVRCSTAVRAFRKLSSPVRHWRRKDQACGTSFGCRLIQTSAGTVAGRGGPLTKRSAFPHTAVIRMPTVVVCSMP